MAMCIHLHSVGEIMSVKIYNGLILRNHSLDQALRLLKHAKSQFQELMKTEIAKVFARKFAFVKDLSMNYSVLDGTQRKYPYIAIMDEMFAAEKKVLGAKIRDTDWDKTIDIVLIPRGADLLAVYYSESVPGYYQALLDIGFSDYAYQNSTDEPPEGVDQLQWVEREEVWSAVLAESRTLGELGLTYTLVSWHDIGMAAMDREAMINAIPDELTRKRRVAIELSELEYLMPKAQSMLAASREVGNLAVKRAEHVTLCPLADLL